MLEGARLVQRALGMVPGEKAGSNNWVMRSPLVGHASVANDPHLALQNPSIFYLMQVTTGTHSVGGVAFPGAPVIPIGHNDNVGWGDTVVGYDVTDVYFFPVAAGGLPATTVPVIRDLQGPRGVRTTRPRPRSSWFPATAPSWRRTRRAYYTARWTGQEPSNELLAFFQLNQAKTVDEAFEAVRTFQVGAQNFVFADVNGNIGYYPHAYVPSARPAASDAAQPGSAPRPGRALGAHARLRRELHLDRAHRRRGAAAGEEPGREPHRDRQQRHHRLTAGNDPLSAGPDLYLYAFTDLGYRAARATDLLSAKASGYTLDDFTAIQADNYSLFAADVVPGLLAWFQLASAEVEAKGLGPAVDVLAHWVEPAKPAALPHPHRARLDQPGGRRSRATPRWWRRPTGPMLFHALVPRLAARLLDPSLAGVPWRAPARHPTYLALDRRAGPGEVPGGAHHLRGRGNARRAAQHRAPARARHSRPAHRWPWPRSRTR